MYLPGRNVILLGKSAVFCAANRIERLVLGTLAHNPFPDATPDFRAAMARALSLGLAHTLHVDAPYAGASKAEVIRRGAALGVPFELTLSCMSPPPSRLRSPDDSASYARLAKAPQARRRQPSAKSHQSSTAVRAASAASATTRFSTPG